MPISLQLNKHLSRFIEVVYSFPKDTKFDNPKMMLK
jgi:hypothetical protein